MREPQDVIEIRRCPWLTRIVRVSAVVMAGIGLGCETVSPGPPGAASEYGDVVAINNAGQVIGRYEADYTLFAGRFLLPGIKWAAVWDDGVVYYADSTRSLLGVSLINEAGLVVGTDLGSTTGWYTWQPGAPPVFQPGLGGRFVLPQAVNASGEVTGTMTNQTLDLRSFFWDGTAIHTIESDPDNNPIDLNDAGLVLLQHSTWADGFMEPVGPIPGTTVWGSDLNNHGHIAGTARDSAGRSFAFVLVNGVFTDLGALAAGVRSSAELINDAGDVAGWVEDTTTSGLRGALWRDGVLIDLDSVAGMNGLLPVDLNENGSVLMRSAGGSPTFDPNARVRSFIYQNGVATDVGVLDGTVSTWAVDINDRDQVVGVGYTAEGFKIPFIWENGRLRSFSFRRT